MLRRLLCAGVALLLVVGVTVAQDKKEGQRRQRPRNVAFGKVVSLDLNKDGSGTLTIMARTSRTEEPKERKFKVTKDTKFVKGGGPGKEGTPVEAVQVADTFKKDATVAVRFEGEGEAKTAKTVAAVTPRPRPNR
jgi:hypothetical protein